MNISDLKAIVEHLPHEITPEQFSEIEMEVENILAVQRQADMQALGDYEQRCAKLREKLGMNVSAPPPVRPPANTTRAEIDETDAGNGIAGWDENGLGGDAQSLVDELAALRERTQEKRRRLG